MYLGTLALRRFRSCDDVTVTFDPALTILVGENASGKSALIDALRLCTQPASGRQTTWFAADRDLTRDSVVGTPVELEARYTDLNAPESAVYLAELVDAHDDLIYRASFATDPSIPRRNVLSWTVGDARVDDPEPANRRRISHVYLPPLRDVVRDLDGGDGNQLHDVIRILLDGDREAEADFVEKANAALQTMADHPVAVATQATIGEYFSQTTPPDRRHEIELNRRDIELRRIARLLRIQLAEANVPVGDIASTGLGYANLLYIAMIVLQLVKARESDLTLLLVEEPEAHLHPQLQLVLLEFLRQQAASSGTDTQGLSASGRVQVVVTSHSPNLASAVSIKNIVAVARATNDAADVWRTRATALSTLALEPPAVRKIDRYLNATRAALLFARHVTLVEGMAEMVLLPALAQQRLATPQGATPEEQSICAARRRQFHGASLISVEGVDFEPFLSLLLSGPHERVDKVIVVTDGDKGAGTQRKARYETTFAEATSSGRLRVFVGGSTLEAELFSEGANEEILKSAFLQLHPRSEDNWNRVATAAEGQGSEERANTFAKAISKKEDDADFSLNISKGDFAHLVAEASGAREADEDSLVIPGYLADAIDALTELRSPS